MVSRLNDFTNYLDVLVTISNPTSHAKASKLIYIANSTERLLNYS